MCTHMFLWSNLKKILCGYAFVIWSYGPASMAQLDAHPTGDQEVAASAPAKSATFFCGD